jgi:hypothetical protein
MEDQGEEEPDVQTLVNDLAFGVTYYQLRELLYYTYNRPDSVEWIFGNRTVDIKITAPPMVSISASHSANARSWPIMMPTSRRSRPCGGARCRLGSLAVVPHERDHVEYGCHGGKLPKALPKSARAYRVLSYFSRRVLVCQP